VGEHNLLLCECHGAGRSRNSIIGERILDKVGERRHERKTSFERHTPTKGDSAGLKGKRPIVLEKSRPAGSGPP